MASGCGAGGKARFQFRPSRGAGPSLGERSAR